MSENGVSLPASKYRQHYSYNRLQQTITSSFSGPLRPAATAAIATTVAGPAAAGKR